MQEGWPAIHMFTSFQNVTVPTEQLLDIVFHTNPASFDTPENVEAATIAQRFGSDGFYSDGYLGKTAQTAIDDFNAGQALYFLQGTYFSGGIVEALGDKVEMALVPGAPDGPFSVTGGPGLGWGISSKSANPDAAACYIDWRTGPRASELFVAEGGLPAMPYDYQGDSAFTKSVFDAWADAVGRDAVVPYIDFAATNLIDILTARSQELVAGQTDPRAVRRGRPGPVRAVPALDLDQPGSEPGPRPASAGDRRASSGASVGAALTRRIACSWRRSRARLWTVLK